MSCAALLLPPSLCPRRLQQALPQQCVDPRDVVTHLAHPRMVRQLTRRVLKSEVEQLLAEVFQPLLQIRLVEGAQLLHLHVACTRASFSTRRVWIGSFCAASFRASVAS